MHTVRWITVIGITILLLWTSTYAAARELAIICNKDYPSNAITVNTIRKIYLGEKISENNIRIRPMENSNESIRKWFLEQIIGNTLDGYRGYWMKKFYQEGLIPPTKKASSAEVTQAVSQTSGGLGYVWADEVKSDEVKILLRLFIGN